MINLYDPTITHVIVEEKDTPRKTRLNPMTHSEFLEFWNANEYRRQNYKDGWFVKRVIWNTGASWTYRDKFDHYYMACG